MIPPNFRAKLLDDEDELLWDRQPVPPPVPPQEPIPVAAPIVQPAKQRPYESDLDEQTIKLAYDYALKQQELAQGSRSQAAFVAGVTGKRADHSFAEGLEQQGKIPLAQAKDQMAMREKGEAKNPNSHQSELLRNLTKRAIPDVVKQMPGFDQLSAAQILTAFPFMKNIADQEAKRAEQARKYQAETGRYERDRKDKIADTEDAYMRQQERDRLEHANRLEAARIAAGNKAAEKIEPDVQKAGKDLEDLGGLAQDMKYLDSVKHMKDIPGVGLYDANKPDLLDSAADTKVRQTLKRMLATTLKIRSGVTVNDKELERTMSEMGVGKYATQAQFRIGLEGMVENARAAAEGKEAKYMPEVLERLSSRGGTLSKDLPGGDAPKVDARVVTRRYSPSRKKTYLFDAQGNAVGVEEGDTSGQ